MSKRKPKKRQLLFIEWLDHTSHDEWIYTEEKLEEHTGLSRIFTVGWLVKEKKDAYVVASTLSVEDDAPGMIMSIGKGTVVRKIVLPEDFALELLTGGKLESVSSRPNARPPRVQPSSVRSSSS
jgi:hypothetical protein